MNIAINRFVAAVTEFHCKYRLHIDSSPYDEGFEPLAEFRCVLMEDEINEFYGACSEIHSLMNLEECDASEPWVKSDLKAHMVEMLDGIADILYTVIGTAVTFGMPIETAFERVHASNMTKEFEIAGGKPLKGPSYEPPKLDDLIVNNGDRLAFARNAPVELAELSDEDTLSTTKLPCDVTINHITYRKGVSLSTLVDAARRWHTTILKAIPDNDLGKFAEIHTMLDKTR